jgi:alginate O-acetyltransferase complex protein AlgI
VIERLGLGKLLDAAPALLRRVYLLLAVMVGWVFFRADTFGGALAVLGAMAGRAGGTAAEFGPQTYLRPDVVLALVAGAVLSLPLTPALGRLRAAVEAREGRSAAARAAGALLGLASSAGHAGLLLVSAMALAGGTYNPFIYFRF